jgi:hypothetical protein
MVVIETQAPALLRVLGMRELVPPISRKKPSIMGKTLVPVFCVKAIILKTNTRAWAN